jgi:hypothetical protein
MAGQIPPLDWLASTKHMDCFRVRHHATGIAANFLEPDLWPTIISC